jgi:hypothetical protein
MLVTHARSCSKETSAAWRKEEEKGVSRRQTNEQCNWHTQVGLLALQISADVALQLAQIRASGWSAIDCLDR